MTGRLKKAWIIGDAHHMKKIATVAILTCSIVTFWGTANAGSKEDTKRLVKTVCTPCHGPAGISLVLNYPNLAGQKKKYLIEQLYAFRSGTRKSEKIMQPVAEKLSDKQIKDLAKYYAKLDPDPKDPTSMPD